VPIALRKRRQGLRQTPAAPIDGHSIGKIFAAQRCAHSPALGLLGHFKTGSVIGRGV